MLVADMPPAVANWPPAYRSLPDTTSADTAPYLFTPEPNGDQLPPSHLAMWFAELPSAAMNPPPAYKLPSETVSAFTLPSTPEPRCDQPLPFHFATDAAV